MFDTDVGKEVNQGDIIHRISYYEKCWNLFSFLFKHFVSFRFIERLTQVFKMLKVARPLIQEFRLKLQIQRRFYNVVVALICRPPVTVWNAFIYQDRVWGVSSIKHGILKDNKP